MTNLLIKIILTVLSIALMSRAYIGWIKSKKDSNYGITAIMASAALIGLLIYVELFRTTFFEFLLFLAIAMLLFVFRKRIGGFLKKLSLQKGAKIKVTAAVMLFPVGIWLALALFYRTPLGMPIGVKNYLYHKYDEEFEMAGFWAATPAGHPINEFTCWPKNGNKQTDSFNVVRKNTLSVGSRNFASDNYYGIIIREDYENYISEIVSQYFDEFKVYAYFDFSGLNNIKYMSDEFDKKTTLNDFFDYQREKSEGCNFVDIYIYAFSKNISDEIAININDCIVDDIRQNISLASINTRIFSSEDEFDRISKQYVKNNKFFSNPILLHSTIDYKYDVVK